MKNELLPLASSKAWTYALQDIKHSFGHTWESCYAMHLTTGLETYLYVFEDAEVKIVCPVAERTFKGYTDIVTPYGFSGFVGNGKSAEFPRHWRTFCEERNTVCGYIGLNPIFEDTSYVDVCDVFEYNTIYVLDLTMSLDQLFQNMSLNRKRQVRTYSKFSSNFITDKAVLKTFFIDNYPTFFHEKKASQVYNLAVTTLSYLSDLENVFMTGVLNNGKVEAVAVFAYTAYAAEYLFNISLPNGRQYTAALLWHGIEYLKSINIPLLNLGGGMRKGDSVAQFKERFGGSKLPLKCLKQIYNQEIFKKLCDEENADVNNREGFFPGYRMPRAS